MSTRTPGNKATPGPWEAVSHHRESFDGGIITIGTVYAADPSEYAAEDGQMVVADNLTYANAVLIAQAPALLRELKLSHCCATVEADGTCKGCSVSEVIAKAEPTK